MVAAAAGTQDGRGAGIEGLRGDSRWSRSRVTGENLGASGRWEPAFHKGPSAWCGVGPRHWLSALVLGMEPRSMYKLSNVKIQERD